MAAILNGIALHGGFIPYGGTFLTFSDYARNAIRMAALMKQRVVHVFTHDSIGLGEDGPTHQSIEHASSLRLIPNLDVWRPADAVETAIAWAVALANKERPTALLLSRQNLPSLPKSDMGNISRGAYVLSDPMDVGLKKAPQIVLIATGSEVDLALKAQALLAQRKVAARVVSMPSATTFGRAAPTSAPCCCRASRAWPWKWAAQACGGNTAWMPSSALTPLANPRPRPCCSNTSASRPKTWPPRRWPCLASADQAPDKHRTSACRATLFSLFLSAWFNFRRTQ